MAEFVANFNLNNNNLDASFDLSEGASFDALFEIYAGSVTWGNILGDITNQTDLYNILMSKADKTTVEADLEAINDTIAENYETLDNKIDSVQSDLSGDISDLQTTVSDNYSELNAKIQNETTARAENDSLLQGDINTLSDDLTTEISNRESADSGLQTQITNLTGTVSSNYNTLNNSISNLSDTVNDLSDTVDSNYNILDTKIDTTRTTLQGNIDTLSGTVTSNYNDLTQSITNNVSTLNTRITNEVSTLNGAISNEATARANADNNLQTQIDAIVSSSDVFDIVGTYAELQAYDISTVPVNDIIKVLVDSTHNNAATYYRCVENNGVKSWSYIGSEGAYYTKGEADSTFVPQIRTINNKALNQNINLTASDVGALPVGTQIGNGTILLTQGGVQKGTFTLNQTGNATIDFDAVSEDITVDSELSTTSTNPVQNKIITGALNDKQDTLTAGTDLEIVSVGSQGLPNGYTLLEWVESSGLQSLSLGFSGNCTIEFTTQMAHVPTSNEVLLTSSAGASAGTWFGVNSDNTWSYSEISGSTKIDVVMNATAQGLNGTINGNAFSRNVPVAHGTWTLFNNIPTSGSSTFPSFMKLFALKATQNGAVIRNLIPCKNNNNVVGLYDTINSVFYSSTSGTQLIAGTVIPTGKVINFTNESGYTKNIGTVTSVNGVQPDANGNVIIETGSVTDVEVNGESVVTDSVAKIDLSGYARQTDVDAALALKQDSLTAGTDLEIITGSGAILPDTYEELEYIQSDGACYIDTGIISYGTDTIEQKFQKLGTSTATCSWFGSMQGTSLIRVSIGSYFGVSDQQVLFFGGFNYTQSIGTADTNEHVIKLYGGSVVELDGASTVYTPQTNTNPTVTSYLFARHGYDTVNTVYDNEGTKIFYHKQKRIGGTELLDLVPARRIADGELGFYNLVNNTFLTNSGSGTLTGGNVVSRSNNTVINFTNESGFITGIDSTDVTTALGYTPYDATNPNGYTSNVGTVTSVNGTQPDGSGNVAITIPTVNNGTLTITQDGNTLGTFTANQSTNATINIPGGGNVEIDDVTITQNVDDELQTVAVIDDNGGSAIKTWTGTRAEYDAIVTKDADTLYNITDDTDEIVIDLASKADIDGSNMVSSVKNFDGGWVHSMLYLINSNTSLAAQTSRSFDLSSYLPNDGYQYEVIVSITGTTSATSGQAFNTWFKSDIFTNTYSFVGTRVVTRTSSTMNSGTTVTIPVGTGRSLAIYNGSSYAGSIVELWLSGYRRIGTNQ